MEKRNESNSFGGNITKKDLPPLLDLFKKDRVAIQQELLTYQAQIDEKERDFQKNWKKKIGNSNIDQNILIDCYNEEEEDINKHRSILKVQLAIAKYFWGQQAQDVGEGSSQNASIDKRESSAGESPRTANERSQESLQSGQLVWNQRNNPFGINDQFKRLAAKVNKNENLDKKVLYFVNEQSHQFMNYIEHVMNSTDHSDKPWVKNYGWMTLNTIARKTNCLLEAKQHKKLLKDLKKAINTAENKLAAALLREGFDMDSSSTVLSDQEKNQWKEWLEKVKERNGYKNRYNLNGMVIYYK